MRSGREGQSQEDDPLSLLLDPLPSLLLDDEQDDDVSLMLWWIAVPVRKSVASGALLAERAPLALRAGLADGLAETLVRRIASSRSRRRSPSRRASSASRRSF
ncbi:hypothetical protein [Azospirillum agricola]|uniref:hypothetical protein n=1 Tax=Azospirillum agricola TaxID=1720247 RepID=UPI000A0EF9CC|nr:hypothetical protein [Azospirillum agricola]SMH60466.1 hypothetical protein SAMN02982994_5509 [Azospirillum lipoferum]